MPKGSGLTKPLKLSAALADIVGKKEVRYLLKDHHMFSRKNNSKFLQNCLFFAIN